MWIKRITLLLCALSIALLVFCVQQTEPFLQYVISAPVISPGADEKTPESTLLPLLNTLSLYEESWQGVVSGTSMTVDKAFVSLQGVGGAAVTAHLTGEYGAADALPFRRLTAGRHFYPEELTQGAPVILLNEKLALALFRVSDPIGRSVLIDGQSYTVIGIIRQTRQAGQQEECCACVPLKALDAQNLQMQTLTVWAVPIQGAGAAAQLKNDLSAWQAGGTFYNLSKERSRALLPAWLAAVICGLLLIISAFSVFKRLILFLASDYRTRLSHAFAIQLIPRLLLCIFLGSSALAALLLLFYIWAQLALSMVYVFPEWIPAVPVEISDILTAWWNIVQESAAGIELRTQEVMTLRMLRILLRLPCIAFTLLFTHIHGAHRPLHSDA